MHAVSQFILSAICLVAAPMTALGGPFVPPTENNAPFRRDQLPIDSGTISWLSRQITNMARGGSSESAEHRRNIAKALALALSLDPDNSDARNQIERLQNGRGLESLEDEKLAKRSHRDIWYFYDWFSKPEAGRTANALSGYLGEVVACFDHDHPSAKNLREKADQNRWYGWVAPLSDFEEKVKVIVKEDIPEKVVPQPEPLKPAIRLKEAKLKTVLLTYDEGTSVWAPGIVDISMKSSSHSPDEEEDRSLRVRVPAREDDYYSIDDTIASPIRDLLKDFMGNLPGEGRINLSLGEDKTYSIRRNSASLTGPGFLLAHAALSGKEPNGIVIGEIGANGSMILPEHFWRQLIALSEKGSGGRLIVPKEATEYVEALLTLEKPEFFMKYEVLVASDLKEFVELSSKEPTKEHADAFAKFSEIVKKSEGNQLGSYLVNRFVRQRLQEVVDTAPYHLSAKMLAVQGAGARPRYISKKILAAEIWRSVDIIGEVAKVNFWDINSTQIARFEEIYEEMRVKVDGLERNADTRDRDLLKTSQALVLQVRDVIRALRSKNEDYDSRMSEIMTTRDEMVREYEALVKNLSLITGDPIPEDRGKRKRYYSKN